jgi:hypothetical protein
MAATICRHRTAAPDPQESFQTRQSAPQSAPTGMRCWRRSRPAIQSRGQARIRRDAGRARPLLRLCAYAQTLELVGRGSCMPIDREGAGESDKAAFRVMAMVGVRFQSVRTADQLVRDTTLNAHVARSEDACNTRKARRTRCLTSNTAAAACSTSAAITGGFFRFETTTLLTAKEAEPAMTQANKPRPNISHHALDTAEIRAAG